MRSQTPKVLHHLNEVPLILRVLNQVFQIKPSVAAIVIGHGGEKIVREIGRFKSFQFIRQTAQKGSGHAVQCASSWIRKNLKKAPHLLILCGDTPLISQKTLSSLIDNHTSSHNAATILSAVFENPFGYGRIVRDLNGRVTKIVEEKDASPEQRQIHETNSGIYCFDSLKLLEALPEVKNNNVKEEYYLTDVIELISQKGSIVNALKIDPSAQHETMGINTRADLALAENILQKQIADQWMKQGVTILNPAFTYIGENVVIAPDTTLLPGTMLLGKTIVGKSCTIGPNTLIEDSEIGHQVTIRASFVYGSRIKDGVQIGPFSHLRKGTEVGEESRIGNFTEVKNSQIGKNTKVSHLSYIGDASLGDEINVGAGAITCNFDGQKKHRTNIGSKSFIGSNVNLVAPVSIGSGCIVGAGSTITQDVPQNSLALERSQQIVKEGWVKKRKKQ